MVNEAAVEELAALLGWTERFEPELTWTEVEAALGYRLPADFKELMSRFPSGSFATWFSVFSPVQSPAALARFSEEQHGYLNMYRDRRQKFSQYVPHPLYPEPGGVLQWGIGNESCLFYRTVPADAPDRWPSMYAYLDSTEWDEYSGTASEFLLELLSGRLPDLFEQPSSEELGFYPFDEIKHSPYYPAPFIPAHHEPDEQVDRIE